MYMQYNYEQMCGRIAVILASLIRNHAHCILNLQEFNH